MTVLGIGTDILRTARFAEIISRNPQRLVRFQHRVLHPLERKHGISEDAQIRQLASAWAAKEALFKCLSRPDQRHVRFNKWRRVWGPHGYSMVPDEPRDDEILVSLSHDGEYTVAYAIRQSKEVRVLE